MPKNPVEYIPFVGWVFWEETWADYYGPFMSEEKAQEALTIYCNTYLGTPPREPTAEESARFKELLREALK